MASGTPSALSAYVFASRYSGYRPDLQRFETREEAVDRIIEMHQIRYADKSIAPELAMVREAMLDDLVVGSQRAMQFGGKAVLTKHSRLYNCASSAADRPRFFAEAFWLLLCGAGVGFSVQRHHIAKLPLIREPGKHSKSFVIPDTIEGWADALSVLLVSYGLSDVELAQFEEFAGLRVHFDYSLIRPKGAPLGSSTGRAPGPVPLRNALERIRALLNRVIGNHTSSVRLEPINAYDIVMHASDAVRSGGVRRSATLCQFSVDDDDMARAKTGDWFHTNPQRGRSNNSVLLVRDQTTFEQFHRIMQHTREFGEPGFLWSDCTETLYNPCSEITFHPFFDGKSGWGLCNLSEINARACNSSVEKWERAATAAAVLGTLQAGYTDLGYLGPLSEAIVRRDALLGVSMTGMMDNPSHAFNWSLQVRLAQLILDVNESLAHRLGINPAARATCIKPSGCRPLDAYVSTHQGVLTVGEIMADAGHHESEDWADVVGLGAVGTEGAIVKSFRRGLSSVRELTLRNGRRLVSTLNHPWAVKDRGFVETAAIQIGDPIVAQLGLYTNTRERCLISENAAWPEKTSPEFGWLVGALWGNGCFSESKTRIRFSHGDVDIIQHYANLLHKLFGVHSSVHDYTDGRRAFYCDFSNRDLFRWFETNGLRKPKSKDLTAVPRIIRESSAETILAFIAGYADTDGCFYAGSFCIDSSSEAMMRSLQVVAEAVGVSFGLIHNTQGGNYQKSKSLWKLHNSKKATTRAAREILNKISLKAQARPLVAPLRENKDQSPYDVVFVRDLPEPVYTGDVEVEGCHAFYDGGLLSHNTTSSLLDTASGIHAQHAPRYLRRAQANELDEAMRLFRDRNPRAVERSVWNSTETDFILTFCMEADQEAVTKRDIHALKLLERVRETQEHWVKKGARPERCVGPTAHSVSNTITVRPEEWEAVAAYIYEHRRSFAGVSLLSHEGDLDYPQAPFCAVKTEEELVRAYGAGAFLASGLIEDAQCFGNLWAACDAAFYVGSGEQTSPPDAPPDVIEAYAKVHAEKKEWLRRLHQFAVRYFAADDRKAAYCLKDVSNFKLWLDLRREAVPVDYTAMVAPQDRPVVPDVACAGGACDTSYV